MPAATVDRSTTLDRSTAGSSAAGAPPAGTWTIDPGRALVGFSGKAGVLAPTVAARFAGVEGRIEVSDGRDHALRVEVDVTSMTTGCGPWDDVIGAVDPFDSGRFPMAVYESTRVLWTARGADVEGLLTLRGVTKPVALSASYDVGRRQDRMVVRAGGTVSREAFGLRFDVPGVGRLIPKHLRLEIDVDLVRAA